MKIRWVALLGLVWCAAGISYAAMASSKLSCILTDRVSLDGIPGAAKDTFSPTTPKIYFFCESEQVVKGQLLTSQWIAADTNNVAPPNYKIDEKAVEVPDNPGNQKIFTAQFALSKPAKNWPVGSYHVDVYIDEDLAQSAHFTIQAKP